jgi:hypothetical protein
MIESATAINSLPSQAMQANVPQSDEPVFILTSVQLRAVIHEAIQPLQDEVTQLRATVDRQDEKISALEARISLQEDNGLIQLQLINQLREAAKKEPQPLQKDRGDILRALLAANGGKMLAKDAPQKMHLSRSRFSELLVTLEAHIELKPYHLRKNQKVLVLK